MEATLLNYKNIVYISAEYLKESNPSYFLNCNKTIRNIINTKKLTTDQYIYATFNKKSNVWSINNENPSPKAKLFILKSFSDSNIIINSKSDKIDKTDKEDKTIKQDDQIENAPDILELTDEEKFKDNEGNIVEITVRGTRHHEKCFFRVKDVSEGFDMPKLMDTLTDKRKDGYLDEEHYKYFIIKKTGAGGNSTSKKIVKELYLTYEGMIRLLYVSKSKKAHEFRKWSTEKLFTIQMGTKEQKEELANKLMGISSKHVKEILKTHSGHVSCVYLYTLGNVKELRNNLNIPEKYSDSDVVCKFGRTDNLSRRNGEHDNDYGKMTNVNLRLKVYSYIDDKFTPQAENDIKNFVSLNNFKFEYENRDELIILPNDKMDAIKHEFDKIRKVYAGEYKDVINDIEKHKDIIRLLEKEVSNFQKEIVNLQKENKLIKEHYEKEITYLKLLNDKDNELKDFKIKVYENLLKINGLSL